MFWLQKICACVKNVYKLSFNFRKQDRQQWGNKEKYTILFVKEMRISHIGMDTRKVGKCFENVFENKLLILVLYWFLFCFYTHNFQIKLS